MLQPLDRLHRDSYRTSRKEHPHAAYSTLCWAIYLLLLHLLDTPLALLHPNPVFGKENLPKDHQMFGRDFF
jgi:hypothetical protein